MIEEEEAREESLTVVRRQALFRWAAQRIARELAGLAEVRRVAAFGHVATKLSGPPFARKARLDVAVWLDGPVDRRAISTAAAAAVDPFRDTSWGPVNESHASLYLIDWSSRAFLGRLSDLMLQESLESGKKDRKIGKKRRRRPQPAPGSRRVRRVLGIPEEGGGSGAASTVMLFDRQTGFLVDPPPIDEVLAWITREDVDPYALQFEDEDAAGDSHRRTAGDADDDLPF